VLTQDRFLGSLSHAGRTVKSYERIDGTTYTIVEDVGVPTGYLPLVDSDVGPLGVTA
jgi:hypothetical protein